MSKLLLFLILWGGFAVKVWVDGLNLSAINPELPKEFAGHYDADKYSKSQQYLKMTTWVSLIHAFYNVTLLTAFIFAGGFQGVDHVVRALGYGPVVSGLIFMGVLGFVSWLLSVPFSVYETFVVEEQFGFNRSSPATFFADQLKGLVLGVVIGGGVLSVVLWFFEFAGPAAWLWSWGGVTAIQLFLVFVAPVVIMPLFNKFIPLAEGELKSEIEKFSSAQKFTLNGIFTMDGSKRSTKANAYFTGFGSLKRIVLFDTLVSRFSVPELIAVLAHEIGHYKRKHIVKQIVLSIGSLGLMFYLLSLSLNNRFLFEAFGMTQTSVYASLVFFSLFYGPLSQVLGLYGLYLSRKYEFEADEFSLKSYPHPEVMVEALKKLSVENLSNLTPHPIKVFFQYTHPPVLQRIARLRI